MNSLNLKEYAKLCEKVVEINEKMELIESLKKAPILYLYEPDSGGTKLIVDMTDDLSESKTMKKFLVDACDEADAELQEVFNEMDQERK